MNATQRAVLHADAEALVESIRERAKKQQGERTDILEKKAQGNAAANLFPKLGKSSLSPTPPPPSRPTPPPPPPAPVHTSKVLASKASVSHGTMDMVLAVKKAGNAELLDKMRAGEGGFGLRSGGAWR